VLLRTHKYPYATGLKYKRGFYKNVIVATMLDMISRVTVNPTNANDPFGYEISVVDLMPITVIAQGPI
jgi:hypothetical protein